MHQELGREKDERQGTEKVLMKLLDDSVEQIALRQNQETLAKLQARREKRDVERKAREADASNRKHYWTNKFEAERAANAERMLEERKAAAIAESTGSGQEPPTAP